MKTSLRSNCPFDDLDESIDYPFKNHDSVWILSADNNWYLGRIAGKSIRVGQTRQSKQGFYYPVCYGKRMNLRKYCSPLNGDIKPDTKNFRDLLRKCGLLDDEDEDENMSDSTDSGSSYSDSY
ncbi:hypothetical protein CPB83DRAFT_856728 [Crepidotus variabilis]|uniref:Uncharacterized protein n=1 Tax=Crepidotus variabilis TaxID=179855 RepID=A0A9P6EDP7_9AGAR|nr:hypothetical protein CPB83DRAFT_856728 [Crepidotus variabilis]